LKLPPLDDRKYQDLLDQALARIPVHTPEWTNFGKSDPGVTLIEVFAFLTESLLYRARQIPERNRLKFLSLLGVPLQPAASAVGLVAFSNERGPRQTLYLAPGLQLQAGQVPFRTDRGLDVAPLEAQVFYKKRLDTPADTTRQHYDLLYSSFKVDEPDAELGYYETTPFPPVSSGGLALGDAIDGSLWVALLLREGDPTDDDSLQELRADLAGKTLAIGVVPALDITGLRLAPDAAAGTAGTETTTWDFDVPILPGGLLPRLSKDRDAQYQTLAHAPPPQKPAIYEITLPSADDLAVWRTMRDQMKALESGTRHFPPSLDDKKQEARVLTWIRIRPSVTPPGKILWVGVNVASVSQRARVVNEPLPDGTGEPDQSATLSRSPVLPGNVRLTVDGEAWVAIDDLHAAGPEVPVPDPRLPPGSPPPAPRPSKVFQLDPESGTVRFGDGLRGARPPRGARISVDYDHGVGVAGNVGEGSIKTGPTLPPGVKVTNPIATWGGADAETAAEGEKQVSRWLQHRDRLVTAADFEAITRRTPGVSVARVDVLPAFHPELSLDLPGDAPGVVTLMVIPRFDPKTPETPSADQPFLQAIGAWLAPRRLVTTEVLLRGPVYKPISVSLGIKLVPGASQPDVLKAVERAVRRFLSPLPDPDAPVDELTGLLTPGAATRSKGWPLGQSVFPLEIAAVVNRVDGVAWVNEVRLSDGGDAEDQPIPMRKLELPQLARFSVSVGQARSIKELFGDKPAPAGQKKIVPVPVVPEEC
jgi:hypothetical protein